MMKRWTLSSALAVLLGSLLSACAGAGPNASTASTIQPKQVAPIASVATTTPGPTTATPTTNIPSDEYAQAHTATCTSYMCITRLYMSDFTTIIATWKPVGADKYILRWWREGYASQADQQDFGGDVSAVSVHNVSPATKYIFEVEGIFEAHPCIFACASSPTGWSDQVYLITTGAFGDSQVATASWGKGRVDLIVRGPNHDFLHTYWNGTWHSYESLGGVFLSDPAITSTAPGRLDVFGIGTDHSMWHGWWDGVHWIGWQSLGEQFSSKPAAVSWGANRLDLFGRGNDNAFWHTWWDGGQWHKWESLGGGFTSAPAVTSWGVNRLDLFGRGPHQEMLHRWWDGRSWNFWESLGGVFTSDPAAISGSNAASLTVGNQIDVFGRGTDNAMWHGQWDGARWHLWSSVGGAFADDPAIAGGFADYTVFAVDTQGYLRDLSAGETQWGYVGTAHFVSDTHI